MSSQAAQQAVCQRALATLSAEDSEDLYFSGGQHVTELHAALVCVRSGRRRYATVFSRRLSC